MKSPRLDINIQIERSGYSRMIACARGRTVEVRAYHAREERYKNVLYGAYLQYSAMIIAHKFTNDLDSMSITDYYQVRDTIESMLKMLHEYSVMRACSADVTVYLLGG